MEEALRIAQQRIERFKRFGGVDLSHLDPQERWGTQTEIHVGLAQYKKTVFSFYCEMCGKIESGDQEMEPMCTGPSWTDDHPPHVMTRKYS